VPQPFRLSEAAVGYQKPLWSADVSWQPVTSINFKANTSFPSIPKKGYPLALPYGAKSIRGEGNRAIYSRNKFGQYADMLQQQKDGRFQKQQFGGDGIETSGNTGSTLIAYPPVWLNSWMVALTGSLGLESTTTAAQAGKPPQSRKYRKVFIGVDTLLGSREIGTSKSWYGDPDPSIATTVVTYNVMRLQSSNLSTFMTSSLPFIDDGIPRNRVYR